MCALTRPYPELTPIIRDMQQTARELGVLADLVALRECCGREACEDCRRRLDAALAMLGVPTLTTPSRLAAVPPDPRD